MSSRPELLERIAKLKVGDPLAADTHLGPVISAEAAERIVADIGKGSADGRN